MLRHSRLPFSWTMSLKSPKLNALITRYRESCGSLSASRESKILKKSSSDWLNSGNALIQQAKNAIFVLPSLPGSAEAQVIWRGVVKHLLIAYFIASICAKKDHNPFTCVKVIASQRWGFFETRCSLLLFVHWVWFFEMNLSIFQLIFSQNSSVMNPGTTTLLNTGDIFIPHERAILVAKCDFSYSCAAADTISTDLRRRALPLR